MPQLDLFGMPIEEDRPVLKKTGKKTAQEKSEPLKDEDALPLQTADNNGNSLSAAKPKQEAAYPLNFSLPVVSPDTKGPFTKGNIVFENSNISVKIKSRNTTDQSVQAPAQPRGSIVTKQKDTPYSLNLNNTLSAVKNNIKEALLNDSSADKRKEKRETKPPQKRGRKSFKEIDSNTDLVDVPDDEILFKKQYYSISEVAGWFNVNTSLLRFWENEFDILKPRKNRKGDRLFRPEDVKNLQIIYQLLRQQKFSIEGAKDYLKNHKNKADTQMQLIKTLQNFRRFLLEIKADL